MLVPVETIVSLLALLFSDLSPLFLPHSSARFSAFYQLLPPLDSFSDSSSCILHPNQLIRVNNWHATFSFRFHLPSYLFSTRARKIIAFHGFYFSTISGTRVAFMDRYSSYQNRSSRAIFVSLRFMGGERISSEVSSSGMLMRDWTSDTYGKRVETVGFRESG